MRVIVLSGSPKNEHSITLRYTRFLQKRFPQVTFDEVFLAVQLRRAEKDPAALTSLLDRIAGADVVLWAFPVFVFMVPAPIKRFVERVMDHKHVFEGRYATAVSTSALFYDHTAHAYIHGVSEDLGMQVQDGWSAHMEHLRDPAQRQAMESWFRSFLDQVERKVPLPRRYPPLPPVTTRYQPGPVDAVEKSGDKHVLLVHDGLEEGSNLYHMVQVFTASLRHPVEVVDLRDIDIRGDCLSCYHCTWDNHCVYTDGYATFVKERLQKARATVTVGTMKDRYLSARWKLFYDRHFFQGHSPVTTGLQMAMLLSGPLSHCENLRQMVRGMSEVGRANLVGVVTDEEPDTDRLTAQVQELARQLDGALDRDQLYNRTFLGLGGHLVFRELIYTAGWLFHSDHSYYSEKGLFDWPTRRLQDQVLGAAMHVPAFRDRFYRVARRRMPDAYDKLLETL